MIKSILSKRVLFISASCILVLALGIAASSLSLSKESKRTLYDNFKKENNIKRSQIDNMGEPKNQSESNEKTRRSMELKKSDIETNSMGNEVKTQEEFGQELEDSLKYTKLAIEDLKNSPRAKKDENLKTHIQKMEKKISRIGEDRKLKRKTNNELLKELFDKSDIDN